MEAPAPWPLSPGEFIPIAEDADLIVGIGEWVLREACAQFAKWQKTMGDAAPRSVSVNLSRKQLMLADLPNVIKGVLEGVGMAPECLHLEITESVVMNDVATAVRMLHAIKAIGVKLAMDDFGTGYSSLSCLHQFPLDVLKIDRSFVANIERGRDFAALVHAVNAPGAQPSHRRGRRGHRDGRADAGAAVSGVRFRAGLLFSRPLMPDEVMRFRIKPSVLPGEAA